MQSRFQAVHTALFLAGILGLPLGLVVSGEAVLLVAGLCLAASGVMTVLGHRIAMRGPIGDFLRRAVGGLRLGGAYLVGGFWIVLGLVLVVASAVVIVRGERPIPEVPPAPLAPTAKL